MIFANFASLLPTDTSALEHSISVLESSISTLESSIAPLVSELPFWEYFGFVSAALVAIGVLLELHDIWHRHGEDKTAWALSFFGVSKSPEKPRFIKKYGVEFASVILVAGGITGEVGAGLMIESKNTALRAIDIELRSKNAELRSKSDQLLALITQQAGEAKDSAAAAEASAKAAGVEADKVKKRAEEIDEELARAEYLMSARTVQNRDELVAKLKQRFHGRDIVLMSYKGDQEGWGLCAQLWDVAHAAEMNPVNACGMQDFAIQGFGGSPVSPLVSPMAVSGPNAQETVDIGGMLATIGRIPFGVASGMPNGMLVIFVGVKPPFMIGQARAVKVPAKKQSEKKRAIP